MAQNPNSGSRALTQAVLSSPVAGAEIPSLRRPVGLDPPPPAVGRLELGQRLRLSVAGPRQGGLRTEITSETLEGHGCPTLTLEMRAELERVYKAFPTSLMGGWCWELHVCIRFWGPPPGKDRGKRCAWYHGAHQHHKIQCPVGCLPVRKYPCPLKIRLGHVTSSGQWVDGRDVSSRRGAGGSRPRCERLALPRDHAGPHWTHEVNDKARPAICTRRGSEPV